MKLEQRKYCLNTGWNSEMNTALSREAQLVLAFGPVPILKEPGIVKLLKSCYPQAHIMGCSGAADICGAQVHDDSLITTAIQFEHTSIRGGCIKLDQTISGFQAGELLSEAIPASIPGISPGKEQKLVHVLVLSDMNVNGSHLIKGLSGSLPESVTITGGLASDDSNPLETFVFWDSEPSKSTIAILGFYGEHIKIGCSSRGGWDSFGPERVITRSDGNVLYEFDGQSALALYKKYLGSYAKDLPVSGHFFPLSVRNVNGDRGVVRTILAVNEEDQSMTFAGDVPEGFYARLMKTNVDHLIDGAVEAAKNSSMDIAPSTPQFALVIDCEGRRLVLHQRFEEEVESVQEALGQEVIVAGFYSYGEISPFARGTKCELHNQTMTVITFSEELV